MASENQKKIVAKNLEKLLNRLGKNQTDMARDLNFPEMTVSNWMKAKTYPRPDKVQLMADYFGVYRSDITDDKQGAIIKASSYPYLPTTISAGVPISVESINLDSVEHISVPDGVMGKWAGHEDVFFLRVNGQSMNKTIPDQSLIAVKPTNELENLKDGDIVVYSDNHEYSVKRMFKQEDRIIFRPHSTDIRFTDYIVSTDNENLVIYGKVVVYIVEMD